MDCLKKCVPQIVWDMTPVVVFAAGSVWVVSHVGTQVLAYVSQRRVLNKWKNTPKDVVILHQIARGKTAPNLSPFALKLETYLRMANITYEVDEESPFGPKGKIPWITLNGEHYGDSELILKLLAKKFNKTLGSYSAEQKAVAHLARVTADEFLYWGLCTWRYMYGNPTDLNKIFAMSPYVIAAFRRSVNKRVTQAAYYQGIGRHSLEEIVEIMKENLRALSIVLGKNKFLLGDDPTDEDCAIFGIIAQYLWCMPGAPYEQFIDDELPNLREYSIRMKEHFWPDWDKCLAGAPDAPVQI